MMRSLAWFACFVLCLAAPTARAESRNSFGRAGRTVLSGSVGGAHTNVRESDGFFHEDTWWLGLGAGMHRFLVDDWALGGHASFSLGHLDDGAHRKPSSMIGSVGFGGLYHLALHRRLSLLFEAEVYGTWYRERDVVQAPDFPRIEPPEDQEALVLGGRLHPQLLLHLSPSLAMSFGPGFALGTAVKGDRGLRGGFEVGPAMVYSFAKDETRGTPLEDARHFGARGRRLLSVWARFDTSLGTGFSYARFVRQGLALGGDARLGFRASDVVGDTAYLGFGLSLWGDLPIARHTSLLFVPSVGYAWKSTSLGNSSDFLYNAHELRLALACYASLHLVEGFVFGVGPTVASDIRVAGDVLVQNRYYVAPGVGSMLTASF